MANAQVAKIGSVEYANLQETISSAGPKDEIILLQDITFTRSVSTFAVDSKVTINLNGHIIEPGVSPIFEVIRSCALTLKDNEANSGKCNGTLLTSTTEGSVNIYGGKYTKCAFTTTGKLSIFGGYFDEAVSNTGRLVISGGHYKVKPTSNIENGYGAFETGDQNYPYAVGKIVAYIGDKNYYSLEAAIEDANNGDVIKQYADIRSQEIRVVNKNITIDTDGFTLTSSTSRHIILDGSTLTITNTNEVWDTEFSCSTAEGEGFNVQGNGTLYLTQGNKMLALTGNSLSIRGSVEVHFAAKAYEVYQVSTYDNSKLYVEGGEFTIRGPVTANDNSEIIITGGIVETGSSSTD